MGPIGYAVALWCLIHFQAGVIIVVLQRHLLGSMLWLPVIIIASFGVAVVLTAVELRFGQWIARRHKR